MSLPLFAPIVDHHSLLKYYYLFLLFTTASSSLPAPGPLRKKIRLAGRNLRPGASISALRLAQFDRGNKARRHLIHKPAWRQRESRGSRLKRNCWHFQEAVIRKGDDKYARTY